MLTKTTSLPADSKEVRMADYRARIMLLTEKLGKLNILEHPCEIRSICSEIISIKSCLRVEGSGLHMNKT
jgi:predicted secreted protein